MLIASHLKRPGYILLAFLLLLQAGGLLLFYEAQQVCTRWQQHAAMRENDHNDERLVMSVVEYGRCRVGNDELRLHGKMYDVRSVKKTGDVVTVVAAHDAEEEHVLGMIWSLLADGQDDTGVPEVLIRLLSFVYLLPEPYVLHWQAFAERFFFTSDKKQFSSYSIPIVAPPPRWDFKG